jgi:hypothetical protein
LVNTLRLSDAELLLNTVRLCRSLTDLVSQRADHTTSEFHCWSCFGFPSFRVEGLRQTILARR